MATDILPIQLSLTRGDLITLWAPRWRDGGDDWEGFLGDSDAVHAFPDAASLAGYVRATPAHDLADHPAWSLVTELAVADLIPDEDHCYDLVGVPEIVADEPDIWTVRELAGIVALTRSLADTCELDRVHDVLDAAEGFALLERDAWSVRGREGGRVWTELAAVIVDRWDEVIDAVDRIVAVPEVDPAALAAARAELAADPDHTDPDHGQPQPAPASAAEPGAGPDTPDRANDGGPNDGGPDTGGPDTAAARFWASVGIDPILVSADGVEHYTLRCYLDDAPLFLGRAGRVVALPSAAALAAHLAAGGRAGHDLDGVSTWDRVRARAAAGDLEVEVDPGNAYHLTGLAEDLEDGLEAVDPHQLDLAVELLLDVGRWAGDDSAEIVLRPSAGLGWLTSFVLRPDPTRLAPSPPFTAEAQRWRQLVADTLPRFHRP